MACAAAITAVLLAMARHVYTAGESEVLQTVKAGLDPTGEVLSSWIPGKDPCSGSFVGVGCDSSGRVSNLSLRGMGLNGSIPAAISGLSSLTALYLHYNSLTGPIPGSIGSLAALTDLYLNVNWLSGSIPPQLGSLRNLQALQLCCNELSGRLPDSLGHLGMLSLLALQHNRLEGNIPASLGQLTSLKHLDLSYNTLTGPIPSALNNLGQITTLDVRSNNLSGYVPPGLRTLEEGFVYSNNTGLCGQGFSNLPSCSGSQVTIQRPEPLGAISPVQSAEAPSLIPRHPATLMQPQAKPGSIAAVPGQLTSHTSRVPTGAVIGGVSAVTCGVLLAVLISFVWFRRQKQRIGSASEAKGPASSLSPDKHQAKKKSISVDLNQDTGKGSLHLVAPLAMQSISGSSMRCFQYRLDELELATNYFSDKYLLARKSTVSIYRAVMRDGSTVVIKEYTKTKLAEVSDEEFESALSSIVQLKHSNIVKLRGFCCVKGGLQCYLVYDYVPNGTLFEHLHGGTSSPLDWTSRVHIAHGVAKGLDYLHRNGEQVIVWASNVLLDDNYNPLVSSCGVGKFLADEIVYANIKTSAVLGYLAPEYGIVGHLGEKSDVYAFGVLLLELLTGSKPVLDTRSSINLSPDGSGLTHLANFARPYFESGQLHLIMDPSLGGKYSTSAAMGIATIGFACVSPDAEQRPPMNEAVQRLYELESLEGGVDAGFSSSGEEYPTRQQAAYVEKMLDYGR